jgi:hypothetical protein
MKKRISHLFVASVVTVAAVLVVSGLAAAEMSCPDGRPNARGTAVFADGTKAPGGVVRTCAVRG